MRELRKSECQRASIKYSVIYAALGLAIAFLLALLMFGADGIVTMFGSYRFQDSFIAAISALYAAALILGLIAGGLIYRVGIHGAGIWFIGIGLAWSCTFLSVFIGSSVIFLSERHYELSTFLAFKNFIIAPVLWVMFMGGFPAVGLGLLYAAGVKKAVSESHK